jgi:hypothetical protein
MPRPVGTNIGMRLELVSISFVFGPTLDRRCKLTVGLKPFEQQEDEPPRGPMLYLYHSILCLIHYGGCTHGCAGYQSS